MTLVDIPLWRVALGYLLLIVPLTVVVWLRLALVGPILSAVARMTLQLLFVGLYLQVVFKISAWWLTSLWLIVMILAADYSVVHGAGLRLRRLAGPLFAALVVGAIPPLMYFLAAVIGLPYVLEARYAIPIFGMILGNCMRAGIMGLRSFCNQVQTQQRFMLTSLAQGASLAEALLPFVREAYVSAIYPTVERIATVGLVSLPGMMTGVVLTGASPFTAVKYQSVIMLSVVAGTSVALLVAIWLSVRVAFTPYGTFDASCLVAGGGQGQKKRLR